MTSDPPFPLEPEVIARAISMPLDIWPGNCHGVAEAVLRTLPTEGMRLVRGHFDGPVSRASVYRGSVQQHSWLRLGDGRILDPTRWCMDRPDRPYLYIGENDAYDEAGIALSQVSRAAYAGSLSAIGKPGPEDMIQRRLSDLPDAQRIEIFEALGQPDGSYSSLAMSFTEPVEHLEDPQRLYRALEAGGMRALIKSDNWVRVREPERVTPGRGVNMFHAPPPREEMTDSQILFRLFCRYLSIEHRGERIEQELEEIGYGLQDLHDALNEMERMLRIDPDLDWTPSSYRHVLCLAAMDLLGKGFGQELKVERHADSLGMDRDGLDQALARFAEPTGLDLIWIWPPRKRETECPSEAMEGPDP